MGHIALYREWRPRTFDEVVEQKYTVAALRQAVISKSIAHAYLFSGTRGTGKTTLAQVFSRAINCLDPQNGNPCNKCDICKGILSGSLLDVIEMDAASNNSVDNIRRLCDEIVFMPSQAKYKVYIIDEVHMLSAGAFNALLKTLEEPPAHAVFILATTEPHRIPPTILSRCQRYEFRRIPVPEISGRLSDICKKDNIKATEEALTTISKLSDGALRDAISLLDQARSAFQKELQKEDILSLVGLVNDEFMYKMALSIAMKSPSKALDLVERLLLDGRDIIKFTGDLAKYFRNVMICHVSENPENLINYPDETIESMKKIASKMSLERVMSVIKSLSALIADLKWSFDPRITFEIALIRLMDHDGLTVPDVSEQDETESETDVEQTEDIAKEDPFASSDNIPQSVSPEKEDEEEEPQSFTDTESFAPAESKERSKSPENNAQKISLLWPKLLDELTSSGNMTLYLFLLSAKPEIDGDKLTITFNSGDDVNCREVSTAENLKIISDALFSLTNSRFKVKTYIDSANESDKSPKENTPLQESQSPGIDSLKKSAEDLGIAFNIEE